MPLIIALTVIIQAFFIWHVFSTGRPYWWAFVILSFPVMGCVIYYFVEVFRGSREHRSANRTAHRIAQALNPEGELKKRVSELGLCGSIDNKLALAAECLRSGMPEDAAKLYQSCLSGPYAEDPAIQFGLVEALVAAGRFEAAAQRLTQLRQAAPDFHGPACELLRARIDEGRDRKDDALRAYQAAVASFVGLEARCRYGLFLKKLGNAESAHHVFDEILAHARRAGVSLEEEQEWVRLTKRELVA